MKPQYIHGFVLVDSVSVKSTTKQSTVRPSSPISWSFLILTIWLAGVGRIEGQTNTVEHYRLEVVAFSLDYPKNDPQANTRQFGPGMRLNESGQVLFAAYWRDFFGQQNTLNLWTAGQVKRVATGGDPVPGFPDMKFRNGLGSRAGNFDDYAFNKAGELLFVGIAITTNTFPSPPPTPFGAAAFDGSFKLLAGATAPYAPNPPIADFSSSDPPYSGNGIKVFSPRTDFHVWLADNGTGFLQASLDAIEINEFGIPLAAPIFTGGIFGDS